MVGKKSFNVNIVCRRPRQCIHCYTAV